MKTSIFSSAIIWFFTILLGFSNLSAQQVGQGSIMLGGTFNFESQHFHSFDDELTILQITPNIGFFPINNLGIGLSGSYNRLKIDEDDITTFYSIEPYVRYYVYSGLFPEVKLLWEGWEDSFFDESELNTGFIFTLGYSFFLNSSIVIEPTIYYKITDDYDSYGMKIGVQAFLGR